MHGQKFCNLIKLMEASRPILVCHAILAKIFLMFLLADSMDPLVCGWYGEDLWCSMLYNSMILRNSPSKWEPLSDMISCGTPNRKMMLFSMNRATCLAIITKQEAISTHLVKQSIAIRIYSCPFEALGAILPITSMPQTEKGHGEVMLYSSLCGTCFKYAYVWQSWQLFTKSTQSVSIVFQQYPILRIYFANILSLM